MMQAIVTKFLPPTNHRGARVKATCQAGSMTLDWNDDIDVDANHQHVAQALKDKLGWGNITHGKLHGGAMPDGTGYCFVMVQS